ncbi:MAG TPA: ElyC/SanA/YdcF family protein [Casimicrobiaceae bacterium]|nr:ElyC/SanA/YdcF family protein [Casimicrobiaceae bacterium]
MTPRRAPGRIRWRLALLALLVAWASAGVLMEGEDDVVAVVPWLVVLGGGVATERAQLACSLYAGGHGRQGVVVTGGASRRGGDRVAFLAACGVPRALVLRWSDAANSFEEMNGVAALLADHPGAQAIVVSDALHMPRLRYLRDRLALRDRVFLRQCRIERTTDPQALLAALVFWFREPLAYAWYRLRY